MRAERSADKHARQSGNRLVICGVVLLVAAVCLTGANLMLDRLAGAAASDTLDQFRAQVLASDARPADALDARREMPEIVIDDVAYVGVVSIPALGLELPVAAACSMENLRLAPCRYMGTPYAHNFVLAGHNYMSHFGRIGSLAPGDVVEFEDVAGERFFYRVVAIEALADDAVAEATAGEYDLTLFTCTLDGASRVTVRCDEA